LQDLYWSEEQLWLYAGRLPLSARILAYLWVDLWSEKRFGIAAVQDGVTLTSSEFVLSPNEPTEVTT
jgi:hypothetical protein